MLLRLACFVILASALSPTIQADDDLVRLPGQGEIKNDEQKDGLGRLVPGGGLLLSFDADGNGEITPEEVSQGIHAAFETADRNEDGRMTPLEQVAWTKTLPTYDKSLANPARFDPDLNRAVRMDEFKSVVLALAATYADTSTGSVNLTSLTSGLAEWTEEREPFSDELKRRGPLGS